MELAYTLATDPELEPTMEDVVVLLIPSVNPDGQQMVSEWYERTLGTPYEGGVNVPLIVALILVSMMGEDLRFGEGPLAPWVAFLLTALLCLAAPLGGLLFHGLVTHAVRTDPNRRFRAMASSLGGSCT